MAARWPGCSIAAPTVALYRPQQAAATLVARLSRHLQRRSAAAARKPADRAGARASRRADSWSRARNIRMTSSGRTMSSGIEHLAPQQHAAFYAAQRFTLNVTRADMRALGFSPSVRLFEAAACGTPIIVGPLAGHRDHLRADQRNPGRVLARRRDRDPREHVGRDTAFDRRTAHAAGCFAITRPITGLGSSRAIISKRSRAGPDQRDRPPHAPQHDIVELKLGLS